MSEHLRIDKCSEATFLVDNQQLPVWPVSTQDELIALRHLCNTFSAEIKYVSGRVGSTLPGEEEVVGLGSGVADAAQLYAHLTQRRVRFVSDLKELDAGSLPSVVVTSLSWLCNELMERLYCAGNVSAPGIICAPNSILLRKQVLLRAAAANLCTPLESKRIDFYPTLQVDQECTDGGLILGGRASSKVVRAALRKKTGVLTIFTHSDGVDALFGENLTLCPAESWGDPGAGLVPLCLETQFCHRLDIPLSEALRTNELVVPEDIYARIFVWDVCLGLLLIGGEIDPIWGLGTRLMNSATIGAMVTTWEIVITSPEYILDLPRMILSGMTLGSAVAAFNSSVESQRRGHRMCLLGDPGLRLSPHGGSSLVDAYPRNPAKTIDESEAYPDLTLLRVSMAEVSSKMRGDLLISAQAALGAIETLDIGIAKGIQVEGTEDLPGPAMRKAVLQYASIRGKLLDAWFPFVANIESERSAQCFVCSRYTNSVKVSFRTKDVEARRISICPICGIIEDVPNSCHVTLSLEAGRLIKLDGALPKARWAGSLLIGSSLRSRIEYTWPAEADGMPARSIQMPKKLPLGPLRLSVILIWGARFAIVSRMFRDKTTLPD